MKRPFQEHLKSCSDLETTYEAIRAGFVALALEKNRRATPHVAEARALKSAALWAKSPRDLLQIPTIQAGLLTAAGVSDKAANHLVTSDKEKAISGLISEFLEPAGANFVEELVFRYLLTRGDALGGSMRNIGGFLAQCKLTRAIIAHLNLSGQSFQWRRTGAKEWLDCPDNDAGIEMDLRSLGWQNGKYRRTLIYNIKVPLVRSNVDLCLFDCAPSEYSKKITESAESYIALGELKGGIDPAGADEHWKTASTALRRIRNAFETRKLEPDTFFVGAAIETRMATEIWEMLQDGTLGNAANLTDDAQLASLSRWLCSR